MVRIAILQKEKCNPVKCGHLCVKLCPMNRTGKDCIVIGDDGKPVVEESLCTGCGICSNRCPFGAVHVINLPGELNEQPIHKYGKNGFHLYNLPVPIFGKVVGIIGRNGIGKSTAIKVLSGVLKPNLGDLLATETDYDALIRFFKGTEAQIFFEKVKSGGIRISYKPQHVDRIPQMYDGTVRDLLSKVDEKGKLEEVASELNIGLILDSNIRDISGGELQRVAIAASVLKRANVYFFDEPTSYLDIKERIRVSKFIRELADKDTAVMVVEHDLIILDYMTDQIHLMYGKEGCFGITSLPKSTKAGINIYLSGFMKDENIRFRDHAIKFETRVPDSKTKNLPILTGWGQMEKDLGKFHLSANPGEISRHTVIGVLGENGIGKTSFVKILAGVIRPDSGEISSGVKVAYKPQYLDTTSEEQVAVFLSEAVGKFTSEIIRPLNIEPLFERRLCDLSGGELQRVSIAFCLSQKADMYLLDEPSAYLDVEQRLIVAKVLKSIMESRGTSCIVVDHDLLFIDYLSQRLLVFDGKPAISGVAKGPFSMAEGMNMFLGDLGLTFRRDEESHRPRANKPGSQMDRKQISENKLYYT